MLAAATYLASTLEPWIAAITFITIGSYIPLTIIVTEWRGGCVGGVGLVGVGAGVGAVEALKKRRRLERDDGVCGDDCGDWMN